MYSMLYIAIVDRPDSPFVYTCVLNIPWPEVQSHSDDSHMPLTAPCSTHTLGHSSSYILMFLLLVFQLPIGADQMW